MVSGPLTPANQNMVCAHTRHIKKQHYCFQHGNFLCQIWGGRLKSFSFFFDESYPCLCYRNPNLEGKYAKTMISVNFEKMHFSTFSDIFRENAP